MSSYRNYVPWNKSTNSTSPPTYTGTTKKDTTQPAIKYDSTFCRNTSKKIPTDDTSAASRIASKYGAYNSGYQRDSSAPRDTGTYSSRNLKPTLEKKDTSHPPVSYRTLTRTGARSRDPSPVEKNEKSSSSSSYNYNRLYPRPYTRSVSREKLEPPQTTIPKYTGRSSLNKDDVIAKYTGSKSSLSREDLLAVTPKYGGRSSINKEDTIPKYTGRSSLNKDDLPRYKSSREDLSSSQKYINSRFLPKNSVEKSYTAYTRPSALRSHETSRKNRELLSVLHAQQEQERSRPTSRCSSIATEDYSKSEPKKEVETETVTVVTRSTSPNGEISRNKRGEIGKVFEKQVTRPKSKNVVDKEVQSDKLDYSAKNSKFAEGSRTTATPWSSFLDMKFSSPSDKKEIKTKEDSPKNISRTSSTKSISSKDGGRSNNSKKSASPSPPKSSKTSLPKQLSDKKLPPPIPKSDSPKSLHSITTTNKDFRKSVLNMNPDGKKKIGRRSNSASSAESESDIQQSEATDISENLTSCKSYHKSSSGSKLPQRIEKSRSRRSPSSDTSTTSEEEKKNETKSSRTSVVISSADELSLDKSPKPPPSPRSKPEGPKSEVEAKSFLMRALAPVTSLFKINKNQGSSEKVNWMDSSTENKEPSPKVIKKAESEEKAWWLDDTTASISLPKDSEVSEEKTKMRKVESGEIPWWLDKNAEVPEDIKVEEPVKSDRSGVKCWWLDSNETTDSSHKANIMDAEYQEKHQIRHIDSGERSWWLSSAENLPEMVQAKEITREDQPKYAIRHQESGEKAWWLQSKEEEMPLGDRASPEGLEMPIDEGRLSPYDNLPQGKVKRPGILPLFISRHRNIDEILGGCGQMWSPFMDRILGYPDDKRSQVEGCTEVDPRDVRIHDSTAQRGVIQPTRIDNIGGFPKSFSPYGKVSNLLFNDPVRFAF